MKKNYLFGLFALATMLFTASCQEEDIAGINAGNSDVVTFAVNMKQTATTRAAALAGRGAQADKLYYGVYEKTAEGWALIPAISAAQEEGDKAPADISSGNVNVEIKLAKQKEYSVIFWATNEANDVCDVDWAKRTMTMKATGATANNEANDAFWAYETVVLNGAVAKTVDLYRPFAQLNIGASKADFEAAHDAQVDVDQSQIVLKKVANKFNMETGAASGEADVELTYAYNAIPDSTIWKFPIAGHEYLSFGYVLVDTVKALVDVELAYNDAKGGSYNSTFTSVPVQRNYRTNIYGNLLSNSADYDVNLKPELGTPDENIEVKEVATASDLQSTINDMEEGDELTIVLTDDIDLNDLFGGNNAPATRAAGDSPSVTLAKGKSLILDLNGKTITATDKSSASFAVITNHGNLTINDATGEGAIIVLKAENNRGWNAYSSVISNQPGGKLTVNGGTIEHLGGTDMAYGIDNLTNGTLGDVNCTINGGAIKSTYRAVRQFLNSDSDENNLVINGGVLTGENKSIFFQDPSAKANNGKLIVGKNAKLNGDVYLFVAAGSTAWPVEVSIAKAALQGESTVLSANVPYDYSVVEGDDAWTVESYFTFGAFVDSVVAAKGNFDGKGIEVRIKPASGQTDNTNSCLVPNRLQKYSNPEVYYAQYQRFAELTNISITNVNFVFIPEAITVKDAWNTAGATTTTAENVNGEIQFMNQGSVTLANCTFDKVAVSPINASAVTVCNSTFNGLQAYAIKDITADEVNVEENTFADCNGAFWLADAPAKLVVTGNTFMGVGRRGAMQFSANGDYTNTNMTVTGNNVEGKGAFLWQLNKTISDAQLNAILNEGNNTYTQAYTDNSIKHVAEIGENKYWSVQEAVDVATEGQTVLFLNDVEQNDGVLVTDKNITVDLNGKTFTVNEGANTNNRNFKINGTSVVTIKNGTLIAMGELTSGAYGTVRTEGTAKATLENVKLYSYRGYGLNVKANTGTKITINNSEIYAQYSGGVEAAGGEIELTDVTIEQKGVYSGAAWCSVAIGVNGGGKVTVNSGTYNAQTIATDANAAQGTWVAYVMSSGGTLDINGGTFNGVVAETAAAANACGLICADRAAVVNINDGTFNSNGAILDMRNNVGTQPNPVATISGGIFSADPTVSGLYSSNLITVAEGKAVVQNANGTWGVIDAATPKTESDLKAAVENYELIILGADITLEETVVIPEGKNITLDLNGKNLSHSDEANKYALNNLGTLTLKDSKGTGSINARGIYNGYGNGGNNVANAKITVVGGTINAKGTNGGAAIFNYGIADIQGGTFTSIGGYSLNNQAGSSMTIADGVTANNGVYNSEASLTVNGGAIEGNRSGCHVVYAWNSIIEINGGTIHNNNSGNSTLMAAGTSQMTVNGGTLSIKDGRVPGNGNTWTSCLTDTQSSAVMVVNGGTFNGGFRVQAGTTMTIKGGSFNDCCGSNYNIYGTAVVQGGTYTDQTAVTFAKKYVADGYQVNDKGTVVAK